VRGGSTNIAQPRNIPGAFAGGRTHGTPRPRNSPQEKVGNYTGSLEKKKRATSIPLLKPTWKYGNPVREGTVADRQERERGTARTALTSSRPPHGAMDRKKRINRCCPKGVALRPGKKGGKPLLLPAHRGRSAQKGGVTLGKHSFPLAHKS